MLDGVVTMTPSDIKAAVKLAERVLSPAQNGPSVPGSLAWWRGNAKDLANAYLQLAERCKALEKVADAFGDTVARAVDANAQRGRGGQHVSFHGDFCNATPGTLTRLEWWAREFKDALAALDAGDRP